MRGHSTRDSAVHRMTLRALRKSRKDRLKRKHEGFETPTEARDPALGRDRK
jgi:hypothetical protein